MLQGSQGSLTTVLSLWLSLEAMKMMKIMASGSSTQEVEEEISVAIRGQIRSSHLIRSSLNPMKHCGKAADMVTQSEL